MPMRNMLLMGLVAAAIGLVLLVPRHTARPDARAVVVVPAPRAAIRTAAPPAVAAPPTPNPAAGTAAAAGQGAAPASRTNDAPSEEEWRAVFAAAPGYKEKAR